MSTNSQPNTDNQEIDLSQVFNKLNSVVESIARKIFGIILFIKKNIVVIGVLFVLGGVVGFFQDKSAIKYDNQIIVTPNFSTADYLYSKIDLINAKINEDDTLFLKNVVGIKETKKFSQIKIEPITDIYYFIGGNPANFEFVKLLAEDGDLKKIVEDRLTSKNYLFHNISFTTSAITNEEKIVKPLLAFLNKSEYYKKIQKEKINNIQIKIRENDSIITQINGVLNSFSSAAKGPQKSDKLVYYNDNTQLNEIIKTKNELIKEQGNLRVDLVNIDKIIKESSTTLNIRNNKGFSGKMKILLPFVLVFFFFLFRFFKAYYKNQLKKYTK